MIAIKKPAIAAIDQIIFKFNIDLKASLELFRPSHDSIPIPNKAAATSLDITGSTVCQPKKVKKEIGKKNRGIAKVRSTMKWRIKNLLNQWEI
jgi:hypothetical protein